MTGIYGFAIPPKGGGWNRFFLLLGSDWQKAWLVGLVSSSVWSALSMNVEGRTPLDILSGGAVDFWQFFYACWYFDFFGGIKVIFSDGMHFLCGGAKDDPLRTRGGIRSRDVYNGGRGVRMDPHSLHQKELCRVLVLSIGWQIALSTILYPDLHGPM